MENEPVLETQFPDFPSSYLKAVDFQDKEINLTYLGFQRKANEDRVKDGKVVSSWKDCLDYCLKYTYPEWAKDKAGEAILDDKGQPMRNSNWDARFPKGYSIVYVFDEGQLESGSMPLFRQFGRLKPKPGDRIVLMRTGEKTETKWHLCLAKDRYADDVPEIEILGGETFKKSELEPDSDVPF